MTMVPAEHATPAAGAPTAADVPPAPLHTAAGADVPAYPLTRRHLLLLAFILLAAVAARHYRIGSHTIWIEEFLALEQSAGWGFAHETLPENQPIESLPDYVTTAGARPWWSIWTSLGRGSAPPLYFVALRGWRELFGGYGSVESVTRSLSAVASLIAIALLFDAARLLHGPVVALWAALLMSVAVPQVQFAQEAGPWSMVVALGLGACAALVRLEKLGPSLPRAVALAVFVPAMLLTHYLSAGAVLAAGAYAAVRLRGRARKQAVAAALAGVVVFAAAWGPFLAEQRRHADWTGAWSPLSADGWLALLQHLALLPVRYLNEPMKATRALSLLAGLLYVLPVMMLRRRPDLLLWVLWAGGTIAAAAALDAFRGTYYVAVLGFTLVAGPAVYAIFAGLLAHQSGAWARHALPAVALLSCLISLPRAYEFYVPQRLTWHDIADQMTQFSGRTDAVVFYGEPRDAKLFRALAYHYKTYMGPAMPEPAVFLSGPPSEPVVRRLRECSGVWVVTTKKDWDVRRLLPTFAPDMAVFEPMMPGSYRMTPPEKATPRATGVRE